MIEDPEEPKLERVTSTKTAMNGKITMKGGLFLSDLKGADDVFALENRYAAYAADRRKILRKKKKPDDLSKSMHDEPNSFHVKTDEAPLGSTSSHGFFDYHFHKDEKGSQSNTVRRGRRREVPLRAKSLDSDDAAALVSAMERLKKYKNDDSSSSSDSDDSSFTSDLCHYHKEMASKTNMIKKEAVKGFTMICTGNETGSKDTEAQSKPKETATPAPRRSRRSVSLSIASTSNAGKNKEMTTSKSSTTSTATERKTKEMDCPRRSRRAASMRGSKSKELEEFRRESKRMDL